MLVKALQLIRTQPIAIAAITFVVALAALISQRPTKQIYQWEIEHRQLETQMNQFSDLVQPPKKR